MWRCPRCGQQNEEGYQCVGCGFDDSRNYEHHLFPCPLPERAKENYVSEKKKNDNEAKKEKWKNTDGGKTAGKESRLIDREEADEPQRKKEKEKKPGRGGKRWIAAALAAFAGIILWSRLGGGDGSEPAGIAAKKTQSRMETTGKEMQKEPEEGGSVKGEEDTSEEVGSQDIHLDETGSLLMEGDIGFSAEEENEPAFGMDIAKKDVMSITFLDTLSDAPKDSKDVSADGDGGVVAWTEPTDGGYDLYIAGEGGVKASPDSGGLFQYYTGVKTIDINGALDTSQVTSMASMFEGCKNLTVLDLSELDTSNVERMTSMFASCINLSELNLDGWDTSNVKSMRGMFYGCQALTSLNLSEFSTSKVESMSDMFSSCVNLSELELSGFDTANVKSMESMFLACEKLSAVDVSGFDTSNVTNMGTMFFGCSMLSSLDVSGFNTSNVTDMHWMFKGCYSLSELDVSRFDTSKVEDMSKMFYDCAALSRLDVGGFQTSNVQDMSEMFYNCHNLTELDISGFDMTNVQDTTDMLAKTMWE